jgi:hypothetical protein
MASEPLILRELTGSQRIVELLDRALPYWSVGFEVQQHVQQKWYPGNAVATIQVFGPREQPVEFRGMWKTRFIDAVKSCVLIGFDDIPNVGGRITAENLVEVFYRLARSGNDMELRWGLEVRRGVLRVFRPDYDRGQDIGWTATFLPAQKGARPKLRAAREADPLPPLRSTLNDLELTAAAEPPGLLATVSSDIADAVDTVRITMTDLADGVAGIQNTAQVATAQAQNVQTLVQRAMSALEALTSGNIGDLPYVQLLPVDNLVSVIPVENWRRDMAQKARACGVSAQKAGDDVAQRATPGALTVVTMKQGQTLRTLALVYLGDSDAWPVIGDANGYTSAIVPVGARVVIPRPPQPGQGTSV